MSCSTKEQISSKKPVTFVGSVVGQYIIPYRYGAWVYDKAYADILPTPFTQPGLFVKELTLYNNKATAFPITQIFVYGGDIEMYCRGSGESDPCIKSKVLTTYPGEKKDQYIGYQSHHDKICRENKTTKRS